jgi:hypothetical protein
MSRQLAAIQTSLDVESQNRAVSALELEGVKAVALKLSLENYRLKKIFRELESALTQDPARGRARALAMIRDAVPRWDLEG